MFKTIEIKSHKRTELIDITRQVSDCLLNCEFKSGYLLLFVPHTTAGITINESYDPSVCEDITNFLSHLVPANFKYKHQEGNADAHIKATLVGQSQIIFFKENQLLLGTWQGVFFCEFDGPRHRKVFVKVIKE